MNQPIASLQIPPLEKRQGIPMATIQALAAIIAEKYQPQQIILFGSHAYGHPQPWSDVDLLVVLESDKHPVEVSQEILQALPPILVSVEIVVRSPRALQRRIELEDPFIKEITERGKVLYERTGA